MPRSGQKTTQWRPDEYGTDKYLLGTGSGIASGAEAGSAFGPWGALVGGIIGGGVGAAQTAEQDKAAQDAQMQQHALEQDLKSTDVYDRMAQASALQAQQARQSAVMQARQAASRAGMTPAAAAEFERQAGLQVDSAMAAQRPSDFLAAQQADLARRQQVLQEYNAAQGLANDAAPADYSQLWGGMMQAANTYGSMNKTGGTVNAAAPQPASAVSNEQAMSVPAATAARTDAPLAQATGQPAGNAPTAVPTGAAPTTAAPQTAPVPTGLKAALTKPGATAALDSRTLIDAGVKPETLARKDDVDFLLAYNGAQADVVPTAPDMLRPQAVPPLTSIPSTWSSPAAISYAEAPPPIIPYGSRPIMSSGIPLEQTPAVINNLPSAKGVPFNAWVAAGGKARADAAGVDVVTQYLNEGGTR